MKEYRVLTMYSNDLQRNKRIFIYLPKSYYTTDKYFPVLYMHDGHNLFDDKQATYGKSWNIMDIYEEHPDLPELIIVGVETIGPERNDELVPYPFEYDDYVGKGQADLYLKFITTQLKPYIDRRFRTFKSPKNTGIMGSSFGGVNTTYAALVYGEYFTRFGAMSNAYFVPNVFENLVKLAKSSSLNTVKKFYMDYGTKESENPVINEAYINGNEEMYSILKEKLTESQLRYVVDKDAIHNEVEWEKRFPDAIRFMFND